MKKLKYIFLIILIILYPKQTLAAEGKECIYTSTNGTSVLVKITSELKCSGIITGFSGVNKTLNKKVSCGWWSSETKNSYLAEALARKKEVCPYFALVAYKEKFGTDKAELYLYYSEDPLKRKQEEIEYDSYILESPDHVEFENNKKENCSEYAYDDCMNITDSSGNLCIKDTVNKVCRKKMACNEYLTEDTCPEKSDFGKCKWNSTNNTCEKYDRFVCTDYNAEGSCPDYDEEGKPCTWTGFSCEYQNASDDPDYEKPDTDISTGETTCKGLFSGQFGEILGELYDLIKFAVPILIIGLSIIDYVKAVASHNQDDVKKTTGKLIKRLIIGLIVFLLPTLIEFLLGLAGYGINDGHCFDWIK